MHDQRDDKGNPKGFGVWETTSEVLKKSQMSQSVGQNVTDAIHIEDWFIGRVFKAQLLIGLQRSHLARLNQEQKKSSRQKKKKRERFLAEKTQWYFASFKNKWIGQKLLHPMSMTRQVLKQMVLICGYAFVVTYQNNQMNRPSLGACK